MNNELKPNIYQGKKIPINELSAGDFENFMYGLLQILFKHKDISVNGKPGNPGDGGFDIDARNSVGEIICIQCKRYSETELDLKKVSNELAKVALRSYIEKSNITEHYIISSGKVKNEVDSARRETSKQTLVKYAIKEVNDDKNFINVKKKISKSNPGEPYEQIVTNYISNLRVIHIWDSGQLNSEISPCYSKIHDLLEHYFHIENVLREYPRPDFDENKYLIKLKDERKYIDLNYSLEKQTDNICLKSKSDNFINDNDEQPTNISRNEILKFYNLISEDRYFVLVIGDGGSGKTTTCKQIIKSYALKRQSDKDSSLPIYLSFDKCDDDINITINNELMINFSTWQSIPGNFLFVFDGLNEIDQFKRKKVIDQINNIVKNNSTRIRILITTRKPASINTSLIIPFIKKNNIYKVDKLNNNHIDDLIDLHFDKSERTRFIVEFNKKINSINQFFIQQPFGLQIIINFYKSSNFFPESIEQLISEYYKKRYERNREYFITTNTNFENLLYSSFLSYIEQLAYLWRIVYKYHNLTEEKACALIFETLEIVKQKVFGFSNLSENDIYELLLKNEILINDHNYIYFQHDIFADFFAAKQFASSWSEEFIIQEEPSKEFLFFTSLNIKYDKIKFIEIIKNLSIGLMARCSLQMGQEVIDYTESYIINNINLDNSFATITFFEAISILKTKKLIEFIQNIYFQIKLKYNDNIAFQAKKYLCIIGDENILNSVIEEAERDTLFPGKITGGSTYLWEVANLQTKIKIAHDRLSSKQKYCLASIETLCTNNCKEDIQLIIDAITNSEHPTIKLYGLYYLYTLDPKVCLTIIDEYISSCSSDKDKLSLLNIRFQLKEPDKIDWVINFLAYYKTDENNNANYFVTDKAKEMLCKVNLNDDHIQQIKTLLEKGIEKNSYFFYQIITYHKIKYFESYFIEILGKSDDAYEIHLLLNYFNILGINDELKQKFNIILIKLYEIYKTDITSSPFNELVYSFVKNNLENNIAEDLLNEFDKDILIYNAIVKTKIDPFNKDPKTDQIIKEQYLQEHKILNYIRCLSYCINEKNAKEITMKLCNLTELPNFNEDEQKEAIKNIIDLLNDDEIDHFLKSMKFGFRNQLLVFEIIIENRIINDFRFQKFKELLNIYFNIGRPDDLIIIIEKFWSIDVFEEIVNKLKLFESKHRTRFEETSISTFFRKINMFIISKIFNDPDEIEFQKIMPITYDEISHQFLKDTFSFWNGCFEKRKYTY